MSNATLTHRSAAQGGERVPAWATALMHRLQRFMQRDAPNPAAREAEAVRELANRYRQTDRGFAADLYLAADRHEQLARERRPGTAADRRR